MQDNLAIFKKAIKIAKDIWAIIGIALIMLIAIELGITFVWYIRNLRHTPPVNFRVQADTYSNSAWAAKYYKELEESYNNIEAMKWRPYVYWRRAPYHGENINIDADGIRKTYNVVNTKDSKPPKKVFMFGGSTMWGLGTADDFTIPSIFAKEANAKGINCEVVNYGQDAYVSTQSLIELMIQLRRGNIPDAVVFYDGINDVFSAFQSGGVVGIPHGEFRRVREFSLLEKNELKVAAARSAIRQLSTIRILNEVLRKFKLRQDTFQGIPVDFEKPITDRKALAQAVAQTYLNNIQVVQALAKAYGFKCLFYWQPMIFLKKNLTEYERRSIELDANYPGLKELYLETYSAMQQSSTELKEDIAFHDISSIFNDLHEPIYTDYCHMGEKGNGLIVQRMLADFVRLPLQREARNDAVKHGDSIRKGE